MSSTSPATAGPVTDSPNRTLHAWWQAAPFTLVFVLFFLIPLALIVMVSFWDFNEYELLPAFTLRNYFAIFEGCSTLTEHGDFCVSLSTYLSTLKFSLLEAANDAGASGWQTLWNVIVPLCKTGIIIGSIFVITIVMGDFVTIGVMGGQQIASVGKIIQVQTSYLQFPLAAANAVILLAIVLMIIWGLTRLVDIRKEL